MTNQGELQASIRTITSTTYDYNGDWHALFDNAGVAAGDFNSRLITYLQNTLSSTATDLDQLKQEYADAAGVYNWNSLTALISTVNDLYFTDDATANNYFTDDATANQYYTG